MCTQLRINLRTGGYATGVTGPLCGEFTRHRRIPLTKASAVELWCFLSSVLNKWLCKQSLGWWFETPSCSLWRHCNGCTRPSEQHRSDVAGCCIFLIVRWPDACAINAILAEIQIRSIRYSIEMLFSGSGTRGHGARYRRYSLWAADRTYRRQIGADAAARFETCLPTYASLGPPISLKFTTKKHGGMTHLAQNDRLLRFSVFVQ